MSKVFLQSQTNLGGVYSGLSDHALNDVAVVTENTPRSMGGVAMIKAHSRVTKLSFADCASGRLQLKQTVGYFLRKASPHEALICHFLRPLLGCAFKFGMAVSVKWLVFQAAFLALLGTAVFGGSRSLNVGKGAVSPSFFPFTFLVVTPSLSAISEMFRPFLRGGFGLSYIAHITQSSRAMMLE